MTAYDILSHEKYNMESGLVFYNLAIVKVFGIHLHRFVYSTGWKKCKFPGEPYNISR